MMKRFIFIVICLLSMPVTSFASYGIAGNPDKITVSEGSSAKFTMYYEEVEPSFSLFALKSIEIKNSLSNNGVTLSPSSITNVTPGVGTKNWEITITAPQDDDGVDIEGEVEIIATTLSGIKLAGSKYPLVIDDDDTPGIVFTSPFRIVPSRNNSMYLSTTEGKDTPFSVSLATKPSFPLEDIAIHLSSGNHGVVDGKVLSRNLTYHPANTYSWNDTREVVIKPPEDDDIEPHLYAITATVVPANSNSSTPYDLKEYRDVSKTLYISVSDNDTAGFTLNPSTLSVQEGKSKEFKVKLTVKSYDEITVKPASSPPGLILSPSSLTFSQHDWNKYKTFTVTAAEDDDAVSANIKFDVVTDGRNFRNLRKSITVQVSDNDTKGVNITYLHDSKALGFWITEGQTLTYKVSLATKPTGNVTITLTPSSDSDLTLSPSSLAFTTSNWNATQNITATAAEDDDKTTDTSTVAITGEGGDYENFTHSMQVQVRDNDIPGIVRIPSGDVTVKEGELLTFSLRLSARPKQDQSFIFNIGSDSGYSNQIYKTPPFRPTSFHFTPENWNSPQTVSYLALYDLDDDENELRLVENVPGLPVNRSKLTIIENDEKPALIFSPRKLEIPEGESGTFTVRLGKEPYYHSQLPENDRPISVELTKSADGSDDVTIPGTIEFTHQQWDQPKTVTVNTAKDDDTVNDSASISLSLDGQTIGKAEYTDAVQITVVENAIISSASELDVDEGDSGSFNVKLATRPTGNVTVNLTSSSPQGSVSPQSLLFTSSNWNSARWVTVSIAEDDDRVSGTLLIHLTASGTDGYEGLTDKVTIDSEDNDIPKFSPVYRLTSLGTVRKAIDELVMDEFSYSVLGVHLKTKPTGNVTVNLSTSGMTGLTVSPTSLSFTPDNWFTLQTFKVRSPEVDHGGTKKSLTLSASGSYYDGLITKLPITVQDAHGLGISEGQEDYLIIAEGQSKTLTVVLRSALNDTASNLSLARVNIARDELGREYKVITDKIVSVSPKVLHFDSTNHNQPQTVTITGLEDDDRDDEIGNVSFNVSYYDPPRGDDLSGDKWRYHISRSGTRIAEIRIKDTTPETETIKAGLTLSTSSTLRITEGSNESFTVVLDKAPVGGNVTVALAADNSDVSLSSASLTFTGSNWNAPQSVTVSIAEDDDAAGEGTALSLTASGADYGGVTKSLPITIIDTDAKGLSFNASTLGVTEGDSKDLTVKLISQPSGGNVSVTLTKSGSDDDDVTISTSSLTFSASNWNTPQTVTVTAVEDPDSVNGTLSIALTASGADYEGIEGSIGVDVTDNDTPGLTIDPSRLEVDEGSDENFTVKLTAAPTGGDVTVSITKSGSEDVTVSPSSLTFTSTDWGSVQTVRVSAAGDDDAADDDASLSLKASGANYKGVTGSVDIDVNDDDSRDLIVSSSDLALTEGSDKDFTVKLTAAPVGGNVSVVLTKSGSEDVTFSPSSLTFTPSNWGTPQTVTVDAAEDDDGVKDTAGISLSATGADYIAIADKNVKIEVTDSDSPGLTIDPSTLNPGEGKSKDFTVKLTVAPTGGNVSVALTKSGSGDVTFSPSNLTFTSSNWESTQTVSVSAAEDDDATDDIANISLSASGADYEGVTGGIDIDVGDDDTRGLSVSSSTLGLTEGSTKDFTLKLETQPSGGEVSVAVTVSGSDDVTISPASVTFTDSNWSVPQTVTVSAAEDDDGIKDTASVSLSASGADYGGISAKVTVEASDNDTLGLTIDPSSLKVTEDDDEKINVKLTTKPSGGDGNVSVALTRSGSDDVTLSPANLTFTPSNWGSAQTVTISAADDDDGADDTASISLAASGADYGNVSDSLEVKVDDDDTLGLTVDSSTLGMTEGSTKDFTLKLKTQPSGGDVSVDVTVSGSDDVTISTSSVTFTDSSWNTPQTVTVSAADDDDGVNDNATVSLSAKNADYGGISADVEVVVTDNDTPGLNIDPSSLNVDEEDDETFNVNLTTEPNGGTVTVDLTRSGSDDVTLTPTSLTFTASNWSSAQAVTVSAADDDDGADDGASISLTAEGADYGEVTGKVQVKVDDDDPRGLSVSSSTLGLTEGSDKDLAFSLKTQPSGDNVTIAVTKSGSADVTISSESLTFTPSNWNTPQTITVSAAEDDDGINESASVSLAAQGADYGNIGATIQVDVTDKDTPGLTIDPSSLDVSEGDDDSIDVNLTVKPTGGDVTVALTKSGSDGVTFSPTSLTFTPSNWSSSRKVTISAAEDDDGADDSASISLTAQGADYKSVTANVQIDVSDNDPRGLTIAPSTLGLTEGSAKEFTVALKTQPKGGDVIVDVIASGSDDARISPASLTFTPSNWSAPRTIGVSAAEDDDAIKDTADISLSARGADYGGIADSVKVGITDNDAPGLSIDPASILEVSEGGAEKFQVSLTVQPTGGDVTVDLTTSGSDDVTLSPTSLTFTASTDWSSAQTVTVSAAQDDDGVLDTASISLAASGADYGDITDNVQVQVIEKQAIELVIDPSTMGLTEGGDGIFTAKLGAQPTGGNVNVYLTRSGSPDVSLSSTDLTFTPSNWNVEQSVTMMAAEDDDGVADAATVTLSASGADFGGVTGDIQVQVTDNDAPGLILSSISLPVGEGSSEDLEVKLAVQPSGDVSVHVIRSGSLDVSLSPESLNFTPSNWDEAQKVRVNAAEDSDGHPEDATLHLTASGADYEGITANVQVQVIENEAFGLNIRPSKLDVREGNQAPFTVSLSAQPLWNVSVTISAGDNPDVTLSPANLRFTPSDWNRTRTVTVSAAEDDDSDADFTTITLTASGAEFDDITDKVDVRVIDNDAGDSLIPQITYDLILSTTSLSLDEGASATFAVRANAPSPEEMVVVLSPGGSTDVTFDTDPETAGNQNTLTFASDDWDVDREVMVNAAEDDDAATDRASASFSDAAGKAVITGRISIAVIDDDTPGLSASPATLTIHETSSAVLQVQPDTRPLGNVLLSFDNGDADITLSPPNLIFTPSDWRTARNVTVSGVVDVDDTDDDPADILISASGGDYDGIDTRVAVGVNEAEPGAIPEDEIPAFVIAGAPVAIDEGGTRKLHLRLRNRPTADVTVTVASSREGLTVDTDAWREGDQDTMIFSPSNFNGTRVMSVFASEDENTADESATLSLSATGGNYDGLEASVSVTIDDNDSPALIISMPSTIDEARASFAVKLSTLPSADVNVVLSLPLEVDGLSVDADLDTPGEQRTLLFTPSNFETGQSVFVTAGDEFEGESVTIALSAGGGNYEGISDSVTVLIGGEYTDRGDPRYWWPVKTLALAIPPPQAADQAVVNIGCRQGSDCDVFLDCSAQDNGAGFRGGLPTPIGAWEIARIEARDIVDITGANWFGMGRLGCALHSRESISAQVWTRSGDGVLVNNSALVRSVNIEGVHLADIESIPGPGEMDLSNVRIRCQAPYTKNCTMTALVCFDDEGTGYGGELGMIGRHAVRHLQTSELADIIGHRWEGATLGCEMRSDAPFTVQVLTRTGGGGALVNNNATGTIP